MYIVPSFTVDAYKLRWWSWRDAVWVTQVAVEIAVWSPNPDITAAEHP